MADYIDITAPVITGVTFTPNPAPAGSSVLIAATVTEELLRRMYPMPFEAGEIDAGED